MSIAKKIIACQDEGRPVFSFEFFPPKTTQGEDILCAALEELVPMQPDFVSVTYGAGGSTRERTREIICSIQEKFALTTMAHLTCIGHDYEQVRALLAEFKSHGIKNILALRGDPPKGVNDWHNSPAGPQHAVDLVRETIAAEIDSVGVAGFPEKHPEAVDLESDLRYLKGKQTAGAKFVITQLFFNNNTYYEYVAKARAIGVTIPIIPGIMPVTEAGQIEKFHAFSGCLIPKRFLQHLESCAGNVEKVREIGLAYCTAQCVDLLNRGAPGIHFFTLNRSHACQTIFAALHAHGFWQQADKA